MNNKALIGLGILILAIGGCVTCPECPQPPPCPPSPTCPDTSALESQLEACQTTLTAIAEGTEGPTPPPPSPTWCPDAIRPEEAIEYVGEIKTVQDIVADTYYCQTCNGQPTFLNFCKPHPDHCFTALIWGDERQQFIGCLGGEPEVVLLNRQVCIEGLIELYEGKPEIILRGCDQLTVGE